MLLINYSDTLVKEWHPTKNDPLLLNKITIGSGKRIWWKCEKDHEWEAILKNRSKGAGCPYCSGFLAIKGKTDLATLRPDLLKSFNFYKNTLNPETLTLKSNKVVWWKCDKGHEWEKSINKIVEGYGCPYCSNNKILEGYNDLESIYPKIAKEWDEDKNKILPSQIFGGTDKKYWWKCAKQNHTYLESPVKRTTLGRGCPYCSGQKRIVGVNDLATTHPQLLKQLHKTKNPDIDIKQYGYGSNKVVWWKCEKGHEWESKIKHRVSSLTSCPKCLYVGTSAIEQKLFFTIQKHFPSAKNRFRIPNELFKTKYSEVDIYLEKENAKICIEYDGNRWHLDPKQKQVDIQKTNKLLTDGYLVIRIREEPLGSLNLSHKNYVEIHYKYGTSLEPILTEIKNLIRERVIT